MNTRLPFCGDCGRVGTRLSGLHPSDAGLVRWTLYVCGHVTTEIMLDDMPLLDRTDPLPGAAQTA